MPEAEAELGENESWLSPLADDRARIDRILVRLGEATDHAERADLASELARAASRYEDTLERAVWPKVSDERGVAELVAPREQVREVLTVIHTRTSHIDPRNVYAPDPEGFEEALGAVGSLLPRLLAAEDDLLRQFGGTLTDAEADERRHDVARAYRHASERPRPPRTAVGRLIANANIKLDHALEDVSSPSHPGAETIDGPSGSG
jgi:hypothetical protein